MKSKFKITRADYLKAMRKARRDEEIREHLHPVNINRVHKSKKVYNRKRNKADLNKDLPYFILNPINFLIYDFRLNSLPATPYSLYKQRESWITRWFREWLPAPPLFIEEVAAKLTEEFYHFAEQFCKYTEK